jgi:hypothetical protein
VEWLVLGHYGRSGLAVGRRKQAKPKVTVQLSIYSNIFKRLELIRSKGVLLEFEHFQIKYVFVGY